MWGCQVGVILFFIVMVFLIIFHVVSHRRMDSTKKKLYYMSLIFAVVFAFIPTKGERNDGFLHFGIPAENFTYYGRWEFWFNPLGFFSTFLCCIGFLD